MLRGLTPPGLASRVPEALSSLKSSPLGSSSVLCEIHNFADRPSDTALNLETVSSVVFHMLPFNFSSRKPRGFLHLEVDTPFSVEKISL